MNLGLRKSLSVALFSVQAFAGLALVEVPAQRAWAQEDVDNVNLEDLLNIQVVTASRREEDSSLAPATIRVITDRDIQDHGYKDLKDIFRDLPGFDISENVTGEVRTLAIARGILGENKLLVLKDGKRINAITGERLVMGNNMPLFNAKRIEIMYGPGSVLYGADAYSAVVNIITKDFDDLKAAGSHGIADVAYGTENRVDLGLMAGAQIADGIDTLWSARYFGSKGIDPTSYPEFSNYTLPYEQPIKDYEIYGRTRIGQAQLTVYRQDAREPGGPSTLPTSFNFNSGYLWHQIQDKVYLDHNLTGKNWQLQSTVGYEDYTIDPQTVFSYLPSNGGPAYKYGHNMAVTLEEKLDYKFGDNTSLVSGLDAQAADAFPKGNNLASPWERGDEVDTVNYPTSPGLPPTYSGQTLQFGAHPYTEAGIFSEISHRFSDRLQGNLGARYDYNSDYLGVFTPRAGLVYKPQDSTTMKLLYGEAYIKPSRYLAYEHWNAGTAFGYYPNPDLRPERLRAIQFDVIQAITSNFIVTLNTYYNFIQDEIAPQNTQWNREVNLGPEETRGFELNFDYQPMKSLRSYLYYSFVDARQPSWMPMNKVARNKATAGLTYNYQQISFTPSMRYSDHIAFIDATQTNNLGYLNDYMVFDLTVRWRNIFKGADLYLIARNILDRKYYTATPFGEGPEGWLEASAPQPGRNGELGFTYNF